MEVALLIEFDPYTGERAGGINPRDPGLQCYGWQDLDSFPAREIRLVVDGRDVSRYEGVPGVKVLRGKDEINAAIDALGLERYKVVDRDLFAAHLAQRPDIKLDDIAAQTGRDPQKALAALYNRGILGIVKLTPRKL